MCSVGFYCVLGSSDAVECETGKYCDRSMLGTLPNDCLAGYYCDEVQTSAPNPDGKICPRGSYCITGSSNFVQCSIKTFNEKLGSSSISYCLPCRKGKICDELGLVSPKDTCPATKFCIGSILIDCTVGHFCPLGYDLQIACQPGTYQNLIAQATCKDCPEGFYCDDTLASNLYNPRKCPPGYYCPRKTAHFGRFPCPAGRLGLATTTSYGLTALNDCTACTETFYCDRRGMGTTTSSCKDGYLCAAGSIAPTGFNSHECRQGSFCIAGVETL